MDKDRSKDCDEDNYIKRYLENNYSLEDSEKFFEAIRQNNDMESIDSYAKKIREEALQETSLSEAEEKLFRSEIDHILHTQTRKPLRQRLSKVASIAASIIVILGILYGSYKYISFSNIQKITYANVATSIGETKTIVLPDGSEVILNSCSKISYPEKFTGDQRLIDLVGEAYFQVARDENMPFIVKTDKFDVKVLGTQFNVKAYLESEILSVSVQSGKVQVDMPDAMMRLVADEKVLINSYTNAYSKDKEEHGIAVWRSGKLQFNRTPIREVVKELERIYNYKIDFKPDQIFDNLITGEHSSKDLESVLKSIELITDIHYTLNENKKTILLYKD